MINVYVVDDSAVVRQTLLQLLQGDPEITLQGSAPNPSASSLRMCCCSISKCPAWMV